MTTSIDTTEDELNCDYCGVHSQSLVTVELEPFPVETMNKQVSLTACPDHTEDVLLNNQCCLNPDYTVYQADAAQHIVEIVKCNNCNTMIEQAPRRK